MKKNYTYLQLATAIMLINKYEQAYFNRNTAETRIIMERFQELMPYDSVPVALQERIETQYKLATAGYAEACLKAKEACAELEQFIKDVRDKYFDILPYYLNMTLLPRNYDTFSYLNYLKEQFIGIQIWLIENQHSDKLVVKDGVFDPTSIIEQTSLADLFPMSEEEIN